MVLESLKTMGLYVICRERKYLRSLVYIFYTYMA